MSMNRANETKTTTKQVHKWVNKGHTITVDGVTIMK
jgi:hypothetical protein